MTMTMSCGNMTAHDSHWLGWGGVGPGGGDIICPGMSAWSVPTVTPGQPAPSPSTSA
jgi:hypothetical protein